VKSLLILPRIRGAVGYRWALGLPGFGSPAEGQALEPFAFVRQRERCVDESCRIGKSLQKIRIRLNLRAMTNPDISRAPRPGRRTGASHARKDAGKIVSRCNGAQPVEKSRFGRENPNKPKTTQPARTRPSTGNSPEAKKTQMDRPGRRRDAHEKEPNRLHSDAKRSGARAGPGERRRTQTVVKRALEPLSRSPSEDHSRNRRMTWRPPTGGPQPMRQDRPPP
jgi:hypothetical protein